MPEREAESRERARNSQLYIYIHIGCFSPRTFARVCPLGNSSGRFRARATIDELVWKFMRSLHCFYAAPRRAAPALQPHYTPVSFASFRQKVPIRDYVLWASIPPFLRPARIYSLLLPSD